LQGKGVERFQRKKKGGAPNEDRVHETLTEPKKEKEKDGTEPDPTHSTT